MAQRTFWIVVNTDPDSKEITVVPTLARVAAGDKITWELYTGDLIHNQKNPAAGALLLVFPEGKPMKMRLPTRSGNGNGKVVQVVEMASPPPKRSGQPTAPTCVGGTVGDYYGIFHYKVMATIDGVVYADVACSTMEVGK
jgi:hypothetical protein